eukprot:COSAG03_NODE_2642_length_2567_cov_2.069287_2_plen_182_part_00
MVQESPVHWSIAVGPEGTPLVGRCRPRRGEGCTEPARGPHHYGVGELRILALACHTVAPCLASTRPSGRTRLHTAVQLRKSASLALEDDPRRYAPQRAGIFGGAAGRARSTSGRPALLSQRLAAASLPEWGRHGRVRGRPRGLHGAAASGTDKRRRSHGGHPCQPRCVADAPTYDVGSLTS